MRIGQNIGRRALLVAGGVLAGVTIARRVLGRWRNGAPASTQATPFTLPRYVSTNGIRMAVYEQGEGFPVVLCHGFPELAFSWRHQLPALAAAGYRAIAPDQRGYGLTDRPEAVEKYDMAHLTGDLVGLLDALNIDKAVFVGHDWGGLVVWMMPVLHPARVAGVVGVNTPLFPRTPAPPIDFLRQMRGENNYIVVFQKPGVADEALGRNVRKTFTMFMRRNLFRADEFAALPPDAAERRFEFIRMLEQDRFPGELFLTEEEMDFYVSSFERTGFTGGINWYRNLNRNWEASAGLELKVSVPSLMIGAEDDVVLPPSAMNSMERFVPDLEKHVIKACGHWTQQERPEEFNRILIDWLRRRFP